MTYEFNLNNKLFNINFINKSYENQVTNLFKACKEYFLLCGGEELSNSIDFFDSLPPNKSYNDKFLLGIYHKKTLIGVVDLVKDFPENKEWIIGLLLISPEYRSIGLGKKIHDFLIKFVSKQNGTKLRIGVVDKNKSALKFWEKLQYKKISEQYSKLGIKEYNIFIMNYFL